MTNEKELIKALEQIEREKGISKVILLDAIQDALGSALKRNFGNTQNLSIDIDAETGQVRVMARKKVVDKVKDPQEEISYKEALKIDKKCEKGEIICQEITPSNFGRIAAQTAKQVIVQRIREAERELLFQEYVNRKADIITGLVQKIEQNKIYIDIGKVEAILPGSEQVPGEKCRQGDRLKAYILDVKITNKGPQVILSRTHPGFLNRLFELEVPEIYEKIVEIKSTSREAGYRSKIAVMSNQEGVDPVGACVGTRGSRVLSVVQELKGEKIDIVLWNEDPALFIANALNPAKVLSVELLDDNSAVVVVPDSQLSLAIGKDGQNARLAAKLTGWKIDIKNKTSYDEEKEKNKLVDEVITVLVAQFSPLTVMAVEVKDKNKTFLFTVTIDDYALSLEKLKEISLEGFFQDWSIEVYPHLITPEGEFLMEEVARFLMNFLDPIPLVSLRLDKKARKLFVDISRENFDSAVEKQKTNQVLSMLGNWEIIFNSLEEEDSQKTEKMEEIVPLIIESISPAQMVSLELEEQEKSIIIFVTGKDLSLARENFEKVELPEFLSDWKIAIEPFNIEE